MKQWMAKKCKEEGCSRSRLPSFTEEEIEMVKGEFQFRVTLGTARRKESFCEKYVLTYIPSGITILRG
jgi:hypothetical protein